jgi:hypothetical protein
MDSLTETTGEAASCPATGACPVHHGLDPDDMIALPLHKGMVVQYAAGASGARELRLFYRDKEISFDEPELFAFGETLAKQSTFRAGDAARWGEGYDWPKVKELLESLLQEGILAPAAEQAPAPLAADRAQASLLAPARTARPRSWNECEAITYELTGRAVELGHLELIVPIFRVAHLVLDADGRQVGEANVFPRALRLDVPTEWLTCIYPGTRHQADRPMNVSALKSMRTYWPQMMAVLLQVRSAFLRRFPDAASGWTVGHLERLATVVLALPTYQLMKADHPVANGDLHPALSSLFRVTDGLRMTMHQMLFIPFGEPTLSPHAPMTSTEIHDYAERNYSFHSETGVCAGPRLMVQEFLNVLVDGQHSEKYGAVALDPGVTAALDDMETAFDYGLLGLQAYATVFSLWPVMSRVYEQLAEIGEAAVADGVQALTPFRDRFRTHAERVRTDTFLATEAWRVDREGVYADMYEQCGRGLRQDGARLSELIEIVAVPQHKQAERELRQILQARFGFAPATAGHVEKLTACLMDFVVRQQAILRGASLVQRRINRLLGRAEPRRLFGSADVDVHNLLAGAEVRRLPYLLDQIADVLGVSLSVDPYRLKIAERAIAGSATH